MPRVSRLVLFLSCAAVLAVAPTAEAKTIWYSPLTLSTAEPQLTIETASPVTTVRVTTSDAGDLQWVQLGLTVPDDVEIEAVFLCYETSPPTVAPTFISQIRLNQHTTPDAAAIIHDDGTDLAPGGPFCVTSALNSPWSVEGTITLNLRLNFATTADWIDIGAVALRVTDTAVAAPSIHSPPTGSRATLRQNYPNPFRPDTVIEYEVVHPGEVEIEIFDAAGRRVRQLVVARRGAGRHREVWDGTDDAGSPVASGVYYYRLRQGSDTQARRMVMLR